MGLNWQWSDKMGECVFTDGRKATLYQGNALMIAVYQWTEEGQDLYSLAWFIADEDHLKNLLGLSRDKENVFSLFEIKTLSLNTRYKTVPKILTLLAKAKTEITVNLYHEEVLPT